MGEDRGANPLPASRHQQRRRKPPGLHLRSLLRPGGLPKASSPIPDRIGLLVSEETPVSSREKETQEIPLRWKNAPPWERALQTQGAPPSWSTDARHWPSCRFDSKRKQSRRRREQKLTSRPQAERQRPRQKRGTLAYACKGRGQACPRAESFS